MARWPDVLDTAACRELPPQVFDARTREDTLLALACCNGCGVTRACYKWMRPQRSYYTGVAAGRVWRDGQPDDRLLHDAQPEGIPQPVD
jgi:hypothetical protein